MHATIQTMFYWLHSRIVKGNLPRPLSLSLLPLSLAYSLLVSIRSKLYVFGVLKPRELNCPVISVGNITVGGTGKTPFVIAIANWLRSEGKNVGVVSRGYGRDDQKHTVLVSDGTQVLVDAYKGGDEPVLIAGRCPGVSVIVGIDRYAAAKELYDRFSCDVMILDDGFQHLSLKRDVNLLLVDDSAGLCDEHVLPRGPMREPWIAAKRATAVIVTRASSSKEDIMQKLGSLPLRDIPVAITRFSLESFINISTGKTIALDSISGKQCVAFCGIANPRSFSGMLENAGVIIHELLSFPDHWRYTVDDFAIITGSTEGCAPKLLITTEKDAVKVRHHLPPSLEVLAARMVIDWDFGWNFIEEQLMSAISNSKCGFNSTVN